MHLVTIEQPFRVQLLRVDGGTVPAAPVPGLRFGPVEREAVDG
jgi:hypothetical protein